MAFVIELNMPKRAKILTQFVLKEEEFLCQLRLELMALEE